MVVTDISHDVNRQATALAVLVSFLPVESSIG